ncbi:anti-sigma factor [Oleiagrimonas soli]|uniref:Regulator of SigK n=1 Tax=Oleiagrimonas soli TaxID=1543381 RepID=A0A099CVC1_9GAMM|nr:anti-sigma factor [Oleiagrimonas soli]KGI77532.1 anti-sigma-K factor RskA [Oleiagrimonas soli]MBB6182997.1 anti-sigma-K factor RskA [Oleiagrimonas soli]
MTTTTDPHGHEKLRGAEYVLGVLDAEQRREVERQLLDDPELAAAVEAWQERLAPLAEEIAATQPAAYVWPRILAELGLGGSVMARSAPEPSASGGLWNNLRLWHWIGIGASAVAAACVVMLVTLPRPMPTPTPVPTATTPTPPTTFMVAKIEQDNGVAGWTATMDVTHHRMILVPATPQAIASDRSTQLWLIPPGQKPVSVGVFIPDKANSMDLPIALVKQLSDKALLAVSVEPKGGSPTGQPTGPVIAKGSITGA